jgi:hypothetical protein
MPGSRAGRKERSKGADKQNKVPLATIVAIEQWVCFALGITCMAFGNLGDLYEVQCGYSPRRYCMAGACIRADIAGYGRSVSRCRRGAGTPGMGLALTALRLSSLDDDLS